MASPSEPPARGCRVAGSRDPTPFPGGAGEEPSAAGSSRGRLGRTCAGAARACARALLTAQRVIQKPSPNFELDVLVNGRPVAEYYARGRTYVEALQGAEYELRVRNPSPDRVAVALSVDGLNTIDARHTSAWNASKWVIEPYQTITISGWQMSSERARRFYFTNERDSYGAKLGQTANLGIISAVFFRERRRESNNYTSRKRRRLRTSSKCVKVR